MTCGGGKAGAGSGRLRSRRIQSRVTSEKELAMVIFHAAANPAIMMNQWQYALFVFYKSISSQSTRIRS
jgi:hypothetical protein